MQLTLPRAATLAFTLGVLLALGSSSCRSQQVDPRISGPMIQALQAQLALGQAMLKAQQEDAEARQATLWQWLVEAKKGAEPKPQ
jgi:hypothetical protein